jgi:hypothetical protein
VDLVSLHLEYVSMVGDGERVIDTLEISDAAQVTAATTGRGRATVEMLARRHPRPSVALAAMRSWSNGYVSLRETAQDNTGSNGAT